jgi:hypothetical protein
LRYDRLLSSKLVAGALTLVTAAASPSRLATAQAVGPQGVCSTTAALLLARVLVMSGPMAIVGNDIVWNDGTQLQEFVASWRPHFVDTGSATRCAAHVGPRLFERGIRSWRKDASATAQAKLPPEMQHLAGEVAERINQASSDLTELGSDLAWLSAVLPSIAAGDMGPYHETTHPLRATRFHGAQVWFEARRTMCSAVDCADMMSVMVRVLRDASDTLAIAIGYLAIVTNR